MLERVMAHVYLRTAGRNWRVGDVTQSQMIPRNTPFILQFYTPVLFPERGPATAVLLLYRRRFAFCADLIRIGFARCGFVSLSRGYVARRHRWRYRAITSRRGLRVGCDGDCGVELGGPLAGSVGHSCGRSIERGEVLLGWYLFNGH
jgi:hypothetical protein